MYGLDRLDPAVDEKAKTVRSQVERKNDEVDDVVAIEQVRPQPGVVDLFTLHAQLTCAHGIQSHRCKMRKKR